MGLFNFKKEKLKRKSDAEIYLDILTHMFGKPYVIRQLETADGGAAIHVFFWHDLPEEGDLPPKKVVHP